MAVVINLVLVLRHTFKKRSQTNRRHKNKLFWERNSLESLKAPKELVNTRSFYATNFFTRMQVSHCVRALCNFYGDVKATS